VRTLGFENLYPGRATLEFPLVEDLPMKTQHPKRIDTERTLIDLERSYWQAMQDKDVDTALGMTLDPCLVAGASGVMSVDRQAFSKMLKNAPWEIEEFLLDNIHVQLLSDDVALVAYKIHEKLKVEGKPLSIDCADTSTWVRRDGEWFCASHTEALAGDPYGRDRVRRTH
jgi:ketosteroid isomerase-like protein